MKKALCNSLGRNQLQRTSPVFVNSIKVSVHNRFMLENIGSEANNRLK
jgi:hypothetical protein